MGVAFAAAAIVAVAFIVRKTMRGAGADDAVRAKSPKRLDIVEQAVIDAKRKLVLVRRDDVEHLVMTGGPTDIVIESGIGAPRTTGEAARRRDAAAARRSGKRPAIARLRRHPSPWE